MLKKEILGIDVGASGIKGAIVDVSSGKLLTERLRLETPRPAKPKAMAKVAAELTKALGYKGNLIGVGFPSIVQDGICLSAANIHSSWVGQNVESVFSDGIGKKVLALNDADAAGIASMQFGMGINVKGTVLLITIGSGLGSALFSNKKLIPNTELGHIQMRGMIAEKYASSNARKQEGLTWEAWGIRFNEFLQQMDRILSPELILLGGGASNKFDLYKDLIKVKMPVEPTILKNEAGTIGAAFYAYEMERKRLKVKKVKA